MSKILKPNRLYYITRKFDNWWIVLKTYVHPTDDKLVMVDYISIIYSNRTRLSHPMEINTYGLRLTNAMF